MKIKPVRAGDAREVKYSEEQWKLLKKFRGKAASIMQILSENQIYTIIHGSVARGDVTPKSDVDIVIPYPTPSYKVEIALERAGIQVQTKQIVQATPSHAAKAHIYIDEKTTITFPLVELRKLEREFYKFGGELNLNQLKRGERAAGVNKRLMLIIPTDEGHIEVPVIGREAEVARKLGVSIDIVNERVRVLTRRDEIGRTGVYLKYTLSPDETFEEALKKLADRDPAIRKRIRL
ncbi:MAG: nucleotidyltransferase [Candidatus Methanomethylicota archaeon]|nr:nucleotidyltransferase domain-containing protein [Candidatus Culexmicrobium cathedralense]RLE47331.1 MAG: nucleotidyltransferase [Candidatus Verstraetearchaeota archaeon]